MSTFRGQNFKLFPGSDGTFPVVSMDNDGMYWYECDALVETESEMSNLRQLVSIVTPKRPLGTIGMPVAHVESGKQDTGLLRIPQYAGFQVNYQAYLTEVKGIQLYARGVSSEKSQQFKLSMKFLIMSDPNT